ncbi:MAG: phosphate ABC transporter, permease protein PstA, partial [Longimicrobiales bacterium]
MFEATPLNERNRRVQQLVGLLFGFMTVVLVVPVLIILVVLLINGAPAISLEFLFTAPVDQGRA